jgi:hypothetical protein
MIIDISTGSILYESDWLYKLKNKLKYYQDG